MRDKWKEEQSKVTELTGQKAELQQTLLSDKQLIVEL